MFWTRQRSLKCLDNDCESRGAPSSFSSSFEIYKIFYKKSRKKFMKNLCKINVDK